MDNNSLSHHGILGMKWGIRRFQRKDGSLTDAGKKRRQEDSEETKEETVEERRARVLKSSNASEIYKNKDVLTTPELKERIDRINTENTLAKIAKDTETTGMNHINDKMKKSADTIGNATNLFKKVDEAYSSVANSAIGKTLSKKLGIEPPRKEFNINEFWKNRNTRTNKEMQDVSQRLANERKIEEEIKRRNKQAEKVKAKTTKQAEKEEHKTEKEEKKKRDKDPETFTRTVEGEGKSHFKWSAQGKDYVDTEFTEVRTSEVINNSNVIGQNYVDRLLLLENKAGGS